jgi:signal transduction histidine kinase
LYRILGIKPGAVKPSLEAYMQFVYPDDRETVNRHLDDMINNKKYAGGYEVRIVRPDGSIRWTRLDGEFELDGSGKVTRMFGTIMDITERKRAEEEQAKSKRQAELYLDLMSHDITNMNQALMGYLEMIDVMRESGEIDKTLIDNSIEVINRSSRMISDVKKLTRLQAGKVTWKDVDLCNILSKVKSRYSTVPNKSVTINYTPGENCIVRSGDLLEDVFDNLVANAIRHSTGPVTVDITVDRATLEGHGYYRITVADTGPGIPDDLKKKLFMTIKEIEVGEKTGRRGFGLYLVRTLIDYYHGKVWVEDRVPGNYTKGARFVVMLPAVEK